jgi:hypothetical protein
VTVSALVTPSSTTPAGTITTTTTTTPAPSLEVLCPLGELTLTEDSGQDYATSELHFHIDHGGSVVGVEYSLLYNSSVEHSEVEHKPGLGHDISIVASIRVPIMSNVTITLSSNLVPNTNTSASCSITVWATSSPWTRRLYEIREELSRTSTAIPIRHSRQNEVVFIINQSGPLFDALDLRLIIDIVESSLPYINSSSPSFENSVFMIFDAILGANPAAFENPLTPDLAQKLRHLIQQFGETSTKARYEGWRLVIERVPLAPGVWVSFVSLECAYPGGDYPS